MQTVPELMREHERVAQLAGEVQQHVGMVTRRHRHAVRAAGLAGHYRRIDPAVLEELLHLRPRAFRKPVVRTEDELLGVIPREVACGVADRGVAVPLVQVADVEQLSLDPVVADADVVAAGHRVHQRLHRLVGSLVGQVAGADPRRKMPQAIIDRLFLEDHVEDVAARSEVAAQSLRQSGARLPANLAVRLPEQCQRLVERQVPPVDLDADSGAELLEEANPG